MMKTDAQPPTDDPNEPSPEQVDQADPPENHHERRWVAHEDLILEHRYWTNPRSITGLDDASLREIGEDIKSTTITAENGKLYAGVRVAFEVVKVVSNGEFINLVIDGQRRHRAIGLVGLPPDVLIPVVDLEPDPVELTPELASKYLMRALKTVGQRAGLSSFELVDNAARLRAAKNPDTNRDYTLAEIGKAIGRSESWVSKMLAALGNASPKLVNSWKTGEITDEMFKDNASLKSPDKQDENLDKAVAARKEGDKGLARNLAKESKIIEKRTEPPKPGKPDKPDKPATTKDWAPTAPANAKIDPGRKGARVVRGPQSDLFDDKNAPAAPPAPTRKATPFAVLEDFLVMTERTPPTHDYLRGLVDGVKWAAGLKDPGTFLKPWHVYLNRVQGAKPPKAPPSPPPKAVKPSGSKAKAKAPPKGPKGKGTGKTGGKTGKKR